MSWKNAMRTFTVAMILVGTMALPGIASAQVAIGISVGFAPPEIPVYEQPICPAEGYIWTPGYWAWNDDDQDYYWVPGTWVLAPQPGYLWTPGYWGWGGGAFFFHEGYWGPVVGFYGGINYGFGYFGRGYEGGRWDRDRFYYNTRINNVNTTIIHNTYNTTIVNRNETRVSYNGGNGGISARASREEENAARERHIGAVSAQQEHVQAARSNRELRASENHGRPAIAATARPGAFSGGGVVAARSGGNYNPPANRRPRNDERTNAERNNPGAGNSNRPNSNNVTNRPDNNSNRPPNTGNRAETYNHSREVPQHSAPQVDANANRRYQQEQDKLVQKQNQEHQKLQQQQEKEHQQIEKQQQNGARQQQNVARQQQSAAKQQQVEQRHQQQTEQMEQRHVQQQQKIEQRQQPKQQAPPRQSEKRPPNEKHP